MRAPCPPGADCHPEDGLSVGLDTTCPTDEHGASCALVSDELAVLQDELAEVAAGHTTSRLCLEGGYRPPVHQGIDVELSSPEGIADVGLLSHTPQELPSPQRVQVAGVKVVHRAQVIGACALLDGRPALVELGPVREGRQTVTIRHRPSTPLSVVVQTAGTRTPPSGWLHAIPPIDWPNTEARSVPLAFVGNTAQAPERVPTGPGTGQGVWSVVSVRVGQLVAAKLVGPDEKQVVLTPGRPAKLKVRVIESGRPARLSRTWFEDVLPDFELECDPLESSSRWGGADLDGGTTAVLEVPPGARRCVFVQTQSGEVVGVRAPKSPGTSTTELRLP